jgi:hypothetical protein
LFLVLAFVYSTAAAAAFLCMRAFFKFKRK